jgi:hypothetical protein
MGKNQNKSTGGIRIEGDTKEKIEKRGGAGEGGGMD